MTISDKSQPSSNEKPTRKTDRRTLYTRGVIKDTVLELLEEKPFGKITVAEVCKEAEISRGTFYLHYQDLGYVLDEILDDALADIGDRPLDMATADTSFETPKPNLFCFRILEKGKYHVIFFDDSLSNRLLMRFKGMYLDEFAERVSGSRLTKDQIEAIWLFRISGCFAVAKDTYRRGVPWNEIQPVLDRFIAAGFSEVWRR